MPSMWNSLLVNLHETLNESGWIDLVHDATKGKKIDRHYSACSETSSETARDGTKNFDQIYTYIQDVAKSKLALFQICGHSNYPRRGHEPDYSPRDNQGH